MERVANEAVHDVGTTKSGTGRFGKLGLDVGVFSRWSRLLWGVAILLPLAFGVVGDIQGSASSPWFYGLAGVYFIGIGAGHVAVYWALGERFFAKTNPWVNTAVFVGPAFVVAWWQLLIRPVTGIDLPSALPM